MNRESPRPLRAALLTYRGNMFCGGQGVYLHHLARALVERGHQITVFSGPPYPEPPPGVELIRLSDPNFINRPASSLPESNPLTALRPLEFLEYGLARAGANPEMLAFSLRAFFALRPLHARHRFDVVHDNQGLGYGLLLIRRLGLPVVATIHHPLQIDRAEDLKQMNGFFRRARRALYYPLFMQKLVAKNLDRAIAVSGFSRDLVAMSYGLCPDQMTVVPNGVDRSLFHPRPELRREPGRLLFVGSSEDRKKGVRYLLEALALLPERFRLVIVDGRRYPGRVYAEELAGRLGLGERVMFRDRIDNSELAEEYCRAELMVVPSLFEGFGLPALEAMASGTPLICSRAGALPEVVGEDSALLVPPGDSRALQRAALELSADPERRRRLSEAGIQRAASLFSWSAAAAQVEQVYFEAMAARDRARGRSWTPADSRKVVP